MHSYETVAVLAIAVSAASPALSAPVLESQQHARAGVAAPGGVGSLIKTVGTGIGFGALPAILQDALGGSSTRRALPRDTPAHIVQDGLPVDADDSDTPPVTSTFDGPAKGLPVIPVSKGPPTSTEIVFGDPPPSVGTAKRDVDIRALFDGLLNTFETTDAIGNPLKFGILPGKRAISLGDVGKTLAGTLASLAAADGVKELLTRDDTSSQELIDALQLVSRHFDEHAARGVVSSVLNGLKNTDTLGNVVKNGLISGVASGVGAVGATERCR